MPASRVLKSLAPVCNTISRTPAQTYMLPLFNKSAAAAGQRHVTRCAAPYARFQLKRSLVTLAIETSCDDTSVAIAELLPGPGAALKVHFHETVTANNAAYSGIHPLVALHSHRKSLAPLLEKALKVAPKPDLIAATRGPGMRSNLSVGLDTGKGLAVAFDKPFIGVHHMQAHALTPRLVGAMNGSTEPAFPFLTVLISGGHTLLINSTNLVEHATLAETQDIAIGDCLDKAARIILPPTLLEAPYGKALEHFGFPGGASDYNYTPPARRQDELRPRKTVWNWALTPPLSASKSGEKTSRRMCFSFSGLLNNVERFMARALTSDGRSTMDVRDPESVNIEERREMAREVQRVAFEHLASRILLYLTGEAAKGVKTVVVSGGVASNSFLRHVLRSTLDAQGFADIRFETPPVSLCTDNALMIAWAAIEMWQAGYCTSLEIQPIRKWAMDQISPEYISAVVYSRKAI